MKENERPYIILSAAMTIDGKIATKSGDPELSDEIDWKNVHKLRTEVDSILVGKGTIINDDPKLHIKYYDHKGYYRIILDSNLSIPLKSKVLNFKLDVYPTIVCCTKNVDKQRLKEFSKLDITILQLGDKDQVDVLQLVPKLKKMGINRILLEGGGNVNWSFLKNDLIDEIRITIAPWLIGGHTATSLVEGKGFKQMKDAQRFHLEDIDRWDNYIKLIYKRD